MQSLNARTVISSIGVLVGLLAFFGVLYQYSHTPNLLLSYPFWWPDTLDWTKQAIVILNRIHPTISDPIGVWRPRDLVWLSVMSLALGTNSEWIILLCLGLTAIFFAFGMFALARKLQINRSDAIFVTALLVLNYSFMRFSLYIMVDFLAITAMLWLCLRLVRHLIEPAVQLSSSNALVTGLLLGVASCTQVFTLIPGIVFVGIFAIIHSRTLSLLKRAAPMIVLCGSLLLFRYGISLIKQYLFGTNLDDRLKFLKLTTESLSFYSEALLIFCAPLILVIAWRVLNSSGRWKRPDFDCVDLFLAGTILSFLGLIVSYSTWFEARLLTFCLPLVYLFVFRELNKCLVVGSKVYSGFAESLLAIYLALLPVNHVMAPSVQFYFNQIINPARLLTSNGYSSALVYKGEDLGLPRCVAPDIASGEMGAGYFHKPMTDCDPYLHYNLRVYWCYKHHAAHCFQDS